MVVRLGARRAGLAPARQLLREVPRRPAWRALPHRGGHRLVHGQRVDRRRDRHLPERSQGPGVQRDSVPIDVQAQRLRGRRRIGGPLWPLTVRDGRFRLGDSERGLLETRRFDPEQGQGTRHARPRHACLPRLGVRFRHGGVVPRDGRPDIAADGRIRIVHRPAVSKSRKHRVDRGWRREPVGLSGHGWESGCADVGARGGRR